MKSAFKFCDMMEAVQMVPSKLISDLDENPQNWTKEEREKVIHLVRLYESCDLSVTQWVGYAGYLKVENLTFLDVQPEIFRYYIDQSYSYRYSRIEGLYKEYQELPILKEKYPDFLDCLDDFSGILSEYAEINTLAEWAKMEEEMESMYSEEPSWSEEEWHKYEVESHKERMLDYLEAERMSRIEKESLYDSDPDVESGETDVDPYRSFEEDEEAWQTGKW